MAILDPFGASMSLNPQLPEPQGVWSDPEYLTDISDLRTNFINAYQNDLQQLGYTDAAGNYIPGTLQIEYDRSNTAANQALQQAEINAANRAQLRGTLFSGRRADELAEMQAPIRTQISQMTEDLPRRLGSLYSHANTLLGNWGRGISAAAARAAGRYVPPGPPTGTQVGAPVPGSNPGSVYGDPNAPIQYATAANFESTPYYPPGTVIPPAPGAVEQLGGGGKKKMARGGFVDEPTDALIGEAGPEAVVPLSSGLPAAIRRLAMMYAQSQQAPPPLTRQTMGEGVPGQLRESIEGGGQGGQAKPPNIKAVGLKAAARILSEAAKEHEQEAFGGGFNPGGPMRRAGDFAGGRPIHRPPPRGPVRGPIQLMGRR